METQYTKIDDTTMQVTTPFVETVSIPELKKRIQEEIELKGKYIILSEQCQERIDNMNSLLNQANSLGINI